MTRWIGLLLALPLGASPHLEVVEVNTVACTWSGEATFDCRQLVPPFSLRVGFVDEPDRRMRVGLDEETLGVLTEPGVVLVDPGAAPPGPHRLTLELQDSGQTVWTRAFRLETAAPRTDSELPPPFVRIASPDAGRRVSGKVSIRAHAHNPNSPHRQVDRVEFLVDGRAIAVLSAEPWTAEWDSSTAGPGPHVLTVRAQGSRGLWSETERKVVVEVPRPLLSRRDLELSRNQEAELRFQVPENSPRAELDASLMVELDGPGRVTGVLQVEDQETVPLFSLAQSISRPLPIHRDLGAYAGRTVTLRLSATGRARLLLPELEVRSYE